VFKTVKIDKKDECIVHNMDVCNTTNKADIEHCKSATYAHIKFQF